MERTEVELTSSILWDLGTTGLAELPGSRIVAGFETRQQAENAARSLGRGTVSAYDPTVVPVPEPSSVAFEDLTIELPDTRAFGHGAHPTTRLALAAVNRLVRPETSVLDVGCGTGVLAIAAALMGADVAAVDNDSAALAATATNATANQVELQIGAGVAGGSFDIVVANMLLADLRGVADLIASSVVSGGTFATTGFLRDQIESVKQLFPGFQVTHTEHNGDWVLLQLVTF